MSIKVLVADDEASIREVVQLYLEREGFTVHTAADGDAALDLEAETQPDLLILDIMLPGRTGWEICRALPRRVPVIFLTAKSTEADKITGFSLGADDYVTKPFSPRELVARVKAVLRRSGLIFGADDELSFPGLTIRPATQGSRRAGGLSPFRPRSSISSSSSPATPGSCFPANSSSPTCGATGSKATTARSTPP